MDTSPQIASVLASLGLAEREQKIYLAALEMGEALQLPLAKRAGLKRTTLRELLPRLLAAGILREIIRGKRRYLTAQPPQELVASLQRAAEAAQGTLPELIALQNNLESKPRVYFYEGVDGVKQIYQLTLTEAQTIYSFVDVSLIHPEIQSWLVKEYTPQRTQSQITALNLVNGNPTVKEVMEADRYRQNRLIPADQFPFKLEVLAFGRFVAYIHFRQTDSPSAVLIESQPAADTMRSIHKALWR